MDFIAAEDTRHTKKLLTHHSISRPLVSYNDHNKHTRSPEIIKRLMGGEHVALVSDAGMPGISDPGCELVMEAVRNGVQVVPVPGASAVVTALAVSGMCAPDFTFVGFLPRGKKALHTMLQQIASSPRPVVAYEAPHRLRQSLEQMANLMGDRQICIAREITKMHEEIFRGTVSQAREAFLSREVRGEITLVIGGIKPIQAAVEESGGGPEPRQKLEQMLSDGVPLGQAVRALSAEPGANRNELYRLGLEITGRNKG